MKKSILLFGFCALFGIVQGQHFVPAWTGNGVDHMNFYVTAATIDGVDMQVDDEIGIFDGDICVGAGVLTEVLTGGAILSIRTSRNDEFTDPVIDGFTVGNDASFRVWDNVNSEEIDNIELTITSGSGSFTIGATTILTLNAIQTVSGSIDLTNGWNIFSLPCIPTATSVQEIVQPLRDAGALVKVQDEAGRAYEDIAGTWFDAIGPWSGTEGYKIRVNTNTALAYSGSPNDEPFVIGLLSGWNIISYPFMTSQDAEAALNDLMTGSILQKVQDEAGNAIEQITPPAWFDAINDFETGEGYKVRVNAASDLNFGYPAGAVAKAAVAQLPVNTRGYYTPSFEGNGLDHMNLYVVRNSEGNLMIENGDELAAFDGEVCVGTIVVDASMSEYIPMALSLDDPITEVKDGFEEGNAISLRMKRAGSDEVVPELEFRGENPGVFERMGTAVLALNGITGVDVPAGLYGNGAFIEAFPNPFSGEIRIAYQLAEAGSVRMLLYDISGREVKTLVSSELPAGNYSVSWDGSDDRGHILPPGNYICHLQTSRGLSTMLISFQK